jgi:hypothetical protein
MGDETKYMRIGTSLYKVVRKPGLSGSMTKTIIQWSYGAIRQDESKEYIINIPKYDGFCIVPDNITSKWTKRRSSEYSKTCGRCLMLTMRYLTPHIS